jgi:hypothetical protein
MILADVAFTALSVFLQYEIKKDDLFMYKHFIGEYRKLGKSIRNSLRTIEDVESGKSEIPLYLGGLLERNIYDAGLVQDGLINRSIEMGRSRKISRILGKRDDLVQRAQDAFDRYLDCMGN